jgi:membrane protein DedA with SNARE-associated domain
MALDVTAIIDLIGVFFDRFGYPLVFVAAFLENVFFIDIFIPGSTTVWFAGFYAQQGLMNPLIVWAVAVAGAVLGNQIDYFVGREGIYRLVKFFNLEKSVEKQRRKYVHKGNFIEAFLLYLSGYAQPFLLIALGAARVSRLNYLLYTTFSAATRKGIFVGLGYFLGTNRPFVEWFIANFWWMGLALFVGWIFFKNVIFRGAHSLFLLAKGGNNKKRRKT